MKKFFYKISLFAVIILSLTTMYFFAFFKFIAPQNSQNYQASILDKMQRLNSIEEPKIILVGNSSVAFGFNSELIEKKVGMPTVNLGLHGGLGNAFHEEMAKVNIQKGDIVVVCHSNYSDNDEISTIDLAWITIENHIELRKLIRPNDVMKMIKGLPKYISNSTLMFLTNSGNNALPTCYTRGAFNKYGDNIFPRPKSWLSLAEDINSTPAEINDVCISRLNRLSEYCEEREAQLLVASYPIATNNKSADLEEFEIFQKELESKLEFPVISNFTDYFFETSLFYNTNLHMNEKGVEVYTNQFIKDLINFLSSNK